MLSNNRSINVQWRPAIRYIRHMAQLNTAATDAQPRTRQIAVLFDLDGTLIDSIGLLLASVREAFDGFEGRAPTEEEWVAGIGTPLAKQLKAYCETDEQLAAVTARYRTFQRAAHDRLTTAFPGTLEVLGSLAASGHPMGIVTSKSNEMMNRALDLTASVPTWPRRSDVIPALSTSRTRSRSAWRLTSWATRPARRFSSAIHHTTSTREIPPA